LNELEKLARKHLEAISETSKKQITPNSENITEITEGLAKIRFPKNKESVFYNPI
jgi:hypothetical protein